MRKILLIPALVLIVCCVTVGAFNVVSGKNNRPMTFYDSFNEIASIEFSVDDLSALVDDIRETWVNEESDNDTLFGNLNGDDFGQRDFSADTEIEWLDSLLDAISFIVYTFLKVFNDLVITFVSVLELLILLVKDSAQIVVTFFDIMVKFFVGVPT